MEFVLDLFFTGCLSFCLALLFFKFASSVGATEAQEQEQEQKQEFVHIDDQGTSLYKEEDEVVGAQEVVEEEQRLVSHEMENEIKVLEYLQEEEEKVENFTRCKENLVDKETPTSSSSSCDDDLVNEIPELTLLVKQEEDVVIKFEGKTEEEEEEEEEGRLDEQEDDVVIKLEDKADEDEEEEGVLDEDDDWEGIERNEVEKLFSYASKFVGSSAGKRLVSQLSNGVQKKLYGLHRVAIEGPCQGAPPMALMVAARAKWHAWQQLGNMAPEVAMEQYVNLLFDAIPGWAGENNEHATEQEEGNTEVGECRTNTDQCLSIHHEPNLRSERKPEEPQLLGDSCDAKSL